MAKRGSLANHIFAWFIYFLLAKLFLAQLLYGGISMKNPIVSIVLLFICLKLVKYWFPVLGNILRLIKNFLLFCWTKKDKTTGAKKAQPKALYKKP
jgi:hypothetical protein